MKILYTLEKKDVKLELVSIDEGSLILSTEQNDKHTHISIDFEDLENMYLNAAFERKELSSQRVIHEL